MLNPFAFCGQGMTRPTLRKVREGLGTLGRPNCTAEQDRGRMGAPPHAVDLFQTPMANSAGAAIKDLNNQGITPNIQSGFRTAADQQRMLHGTAGPNPAGGWPTLVLVSPSY